MAYCKCGNDSFLVTKQIISLDEKHNIKVKFIVCSNPECQQIIGILPEKAVKTKIAKQKSSYKPADIPQVKSKSKGALMTGIKLAKQVKKNSAAPTVGNTNGVPQTTTLSSVKPTAPNVANTAAKTTLSSTSIIEEKTKKAKK